MTPTLDCQIDWRHPLPKPRLPHELEDVRQKAKAAFNTAEFLKAFGLPVNITEDDRDQARAIFMGNPDAPETPRTPGAAIHLEALLTKYDYTMLGATNKMRNYVLYNLFDLAEKASSDSVKLKSIELLGKVAEVGLFANKVEVSITERPTQDLEDELHKLLRGYDLATLEGELSDVQSQLSLEREARGEIISSELTDEELKGDTHE
jgi:hypothetical protein